MPAERKYIWTSRVADRVEMLSITEAGSFSVTSHITGDIKGGTIDIQYIMEIDGDWSFRSLAINDFKTSELLLSLQKDEYGQWYHGDRMLPAAFDGCVDVDISLTPFTNSLPVNRLKLAPGTHREITVIYIPWPELTLNIIRQRYTNLDDGLYKYENLGSGFNVLLSLDREGMVIDYPGMWKRVYPVERNVGGE